MKLFTERDHGHCKEFETSAISNLKYKDNKILNYYNFKYLGE